MLIPGVNHVCRPAMLITRRPRRDISAAVSAIHDVIAAGGSSSCRGLTVLVGGGHQLLAAVIGRMRLLLLGVDEVVKLMMNHVVSQLLDREGAQLALQACKRRRRRRPQRRFIEYGVHNNRSHARIGSCIQLS